MNTTSGIVALLACIALAGCGGSHGDHHGPDALEKVPASASESSKGLTNYLEDLADSNAEGSEPVSLANFDPVTPDDTEPEALK